MSLDALRQKMEAERTALVAKLREELLVWEADLPVVEEHLQKVVDKYYENRLALEEQSKYEEMEDAWDREISGSYYDELIARLEEPVVEMEYELQEVREEIANVRDRIEQVDVEFEKGWEKAKVEYEEVAVLRWLS